MRLSRLSVLLFVLALVTAACGGDDDGGDTTAAPTTTAAGTTTGAPTTTAAATTTQATTTTTAAPATTEDPLAAILPLAQAFAGTYTGQWNNTTFGSSGDILFEFSVDDTGSVRISLDLGGGVFGAQDPPKETWIVSLQQLVTGQIQSPLFGPLIFDVSETGFTINAPDVPGDRIATFEATGTINFTEVTGTYLVGFEGGGDPAEGTFEFNIENP